MQRLIICTLKATIRHEIITLSARLICFAVLLMLSRLSVRHIAKGVGCVSFKRIRWVGRFLFSVGICCMHINQADTVVIKTVKTILSIITHYMLQSL